MSAIGILSLQGGFEAHARVVEALGHTPVDVRHPAALPTLAALILPGGESTTHLKLMGDRWWRPLLDLARRGTPILGTCAGAILLAKEVRPAQPSLGVLDVTIVRNGYGRQVDSFEADVALDPRIPASDPALRGVFIRAPRLARLGAGVQVLATVDGEPVAVREGNVIAATFHPELARSFALHRLLLEARPPLPTAVPA